MTEETRFKVVDRRTFVAEDDPNETLARAGDEPMSSDKPSYVQELEARALAAEEQLQRFIAAYKEEVQGGLARTTERLQREAERELGRVKSELALELLEVLDNLDRSLEAAPAEGALVAGLTLVRSQFFAALARLGIGVVEALGQPFDPRIHEAAAVVAVTDPAQDGQVMDVAKPGYRLGDRLVRPALVRVGKLGAALPS